MTDYINTPPVRDIWIRALPALAADAHTRHTSMMHW